MEEGQIVKWHKSEGDEVANGDVLAEIETDKATMELVARGEGVLRKVILQEGATAPVGAVIAVIGAEDEDISGLVEEAGGDGAAPSGEDEAPKGEDEAPEGEDEAPEATAAAPKEEAAEAEEEAEA
ncbi:MAG: hypothetical protein KY453_09855, partial [Gemmatimonadetes bacterium]|nr:hypothetical protein [Gemmatimonadota bacterium]